MKIKNLLVIILLIGLSFNAFSQEEVTIKQVIKNSLTSDIKGTNNQISIVEINTSIPVTINKGEENAIYITGKFDNAEDYIGLCTLNDGFLRINNPKKGNKITIELASDVIVYQFFNNANVVVNKDFNVKPFSNGIFEADNNSSAIFNGKVSGNNLYIRSKNNSRLSFASIEAVELDVKVEKGSEVIVNGKSLDLKVDIVEGSKFNKDNFVYTYLYEAVKTNEGAQISKTESIVYNNDKDAEVSKVTKVVQGMGETGETKIWSPYPKLKVVLAASVGVLNWSDRVSKVDDLFSSPSNEYDLRCSMSSNIGLSLRYKLNKKIQFSTGLLFEVNLFKFKNNVMMTDINGEKRLAYETNPAIDAKSYLQAFYVNIPIGFQYNFYKDLSIHASGIFGINFRTSSTGFQRTYDITNAEITERWGTNYNNFKPIKFEVQAGIGWLGLDLYVKYALTPLFKDNTEREVYPFSIGLSAGI